MKDSRNNPKSMSVDDLYEKDLIDSLVDYISASRKLRLMKMENGASVWSFPSTWLKIAFVLFIIIKWIF